MRFDVDRATAHVRALDFPRPAGTGAERRAAEYVAEQMQDAGLAVERREAIGSLFPERIGERIGWFGVAVLVTISVASPSKIVSAIAALATLGWSIALAFGLFGRLGRSWPPRFTAPIVLASRPLAGEPRARLVVLTHLDSNPPAWAAKTMSRWDIVNIWGFCLAFAFADWDRVGHEWGWFGRWFLPTLLVAIGVGLLALARVVVRRRGGPVALGMSLGAAFLVMGVLSAVLSRLGLGAWALPAFAIVFVWLLAILRGWPLLYPSEVDGDRDNRTGLALLIELARAWPVEPKEGLDVRFAAVCARSIGQAGANELARLAAEEWPACPTLVVNLQAPGYGNRVTLRGADRPRWLGQVAARDLRIPHSDAFPLSSPSGHTPFARRGIDAVSLIGTIDPTLPRPKPADLLQPAMLGATAQLVREVALRRLRREP